MKNGYLEIRTRAKELHEKLTGREEITIVDIDTTQERHGKVR